MKKFADILPNLGVVDNIERLELIQINTDNVIATIENKPGQAGSVAVYHYLAQNHGVIDAKTARKGIQLYAEHTRNAKHHPGKHPNIDRLFSIIENAQPLKVRIIYK